MSDINIRRATVDDAVLLAKLNETVQALHAKVRPEIFQAASQIDLLIPAYRERIEEDGSYVFIAENTHEAVGYAIAKIVRRPQDAITKARSSVFVEEFCVAENYQNYGYGSALMAAVFELARTENIKRVTLDVWDFNVEALEFYEKRGFAPFMHRLETYLD